jgi:hypothetical protein
VCLLFYFADRFRPEFKTHSNLIWNSKWFANGKRVKITEESFPVLIWHWAETQSSLGSAQPAISLEQPSISPLTMLPTPVPTCHWDTAVGARRPWRHPDPVAMSRRSCPAHWGPRNGRSWVGLHPRHQILNPNLDQFYPKRILTKLWNQDRIRGKVGWRSSLSVCRRFSPI